MVSADGFQPPNLFGIGKGYSVHLIGAVLFQELSETKHPFSCGMNIGQQQAYHIFFPDASGNFCPAFLVKYYQGISCQYQLVTGNGFRSGNGDIGTVGTGACPDTVIV